MSGPFVRFLRLDGVRRRLLIQALSELYRARKALSRKPIRELIAGSEILPGDEVSPVGDAEDAGQASNIGWAVRAAAAYAPWKSSCLVQVIAAQKMMRARGIGGVIYLGTTRGDGEEFAAHAWLKHGDVFVKGEAGHEEYRVLTRFSW